MQESDSQDGVLKSNAAGEGKIPSVDLRKPVL